MTIWLCRWPNEEDSDTVGTALKYLRDGEYLASNGDCPMQGDLVVFRNSMNMRNANENRFSTFATGIVSTTQNQEPLNWEHETRESYLNFDNIEIHNFEFEKGAFSNRGHKNWPNSPINHQFMTLNERQRKYLGL